MAGEQARADGARYIATMAKLAHDSILRFRDRVPMSDGQVAELESGLQRLRAILRALGENV